MIMLIITLPCCIISFPSFAYIYQTYSINPFTIKAEITPDSCYSSGNGKIGLYVTGGISPYTYSWNNGASTSVITSLIAATYRVTVTDASGVSATASIQVGYEMEWTDISGISENNGILTKTATDGWGNAGAISSNILNANESGYVEFSVTSLNSDAYAIGLSTSNKDNHYNTIDYAFMYNNQKMHIYENGLKITSLSVKSGNTFKVYREGSAIYYYKNSTIIRSTSTDKANSLIADISIKNLNGKISNVSSSFCFPLSENNSESSYALLRTQLDGGYYIAEDGQLSFLYYEDYYDSDSLLNYTIYTYKREIAASSSTYPLQVVYGENKYSINLLDDLNISSKQYYTLEVINEKNEKWMLRVYNDIDCNNCE